MEEQATMSVTNEQQFNIDELELVIYPDMRLTMRAVEVKHDGSKETTDALNALTDKMYKIMAATGRGLGIAANQVGVLMRVAVIDQVALGLVDEKGGLSYVALINPRVIQSHDIQGREEVKQEECLSLPGIRGAVRRSQFIVVEFMNCEGQTLQVAFRDLAARCVLHEIDHLNGVLITDKMLPRWKKQAQWRLKKLEMKA